MSNNNYSSEFLLQSSRGEIQRSSCLTLFLRNCGRKLYSSAGNQNIKSQIKNLFKLSELFTALFRFLTVCRTIMPTVCRVTNSIRNTIKLNKESMNLPRTLFLKFGLKLGVGNIQYCQVFTVNIAGFLQSDTSCDIPFLLLFGTFTSILQEQVVIKLVNCSCNSDKWVSNSSKFCESTGD